jgi:protein involved in polysaccharide export with SLBB domain/Flp pilus assembly protein TadD
MMKKVFSVLIFMLALGLPVFAVQEQTPPAQNDSVKAPEKPVNANEPPPTSEQKQTEQKQDQQQQQQAVPQATPAASPAASPETATDNSSTKPKDETGVGNTVAQQSDEKSSGGTASKVAQSAGNNNSSGPATGAADFYKIGLAHYESKQFKNAVDAFKRASRLKPNDADIHYNLGLAYYSSNMYKEAAKAYEQAIKLKPDWSDAHFRLGWMYYILGKKEASFEQYKILQTLNPEQANTLYRIIKVETANTTAASSKVDSKAGTKQASQPDPKDDTKVDSRLVVSDISQPAQPTDNSRTNTLNAPSSSVIASTKNDAPAKEAVEPSATVDEASLVKTYRVGVGDVLDIRLTNAPTTRSTLYTVMEGGLIEYPLAGGLMTVSGLTTEEINARLSAELKRRAVNQNPNEIMITVRDYASHNVVISGLVNNPGMRILHREAVPLYVVLADAQTRADASRALIMRASGQLMVDLTDPTQMNVLVRPGDVITISARPPQFYYLGGKITTPGQKSFQPGITLVQAILAAGGFERAKGDVIEISREGEDGRLTTTRYKLKDIRSGKVPDPRLQPGDRVEVSH